MFEKIYVYYYENVKNNLTGKEHFELAANYEKLNNIYKAIEHYKLAAKGKVITAYLKLALIYEERLDLKQAIFYYHKYMANLGNYVNKNVIVKLNNAYLNLANLFKEKNDTPQAIYYYEKYIERTGGQNVYETLNKLYFSRAETLAAKAENREAIYAYYKSALYGNDQALNKLIAYVNDIQIPDPNIKSNEYECKRDGYYYIGMVYENRKNRHDSIQYYHIAAKSYLDARSMFRLAQLYEPGHESETDAMHPSSTSVIPAKWLKSLVWYRKAVQQYSSEALHVLLEKSKTDPWFGFLLAELYRDGEGVGNKNIELGRDYFKRAVIILRQKADSKDKDAAFLLARLNDPDYAEDYKWTEARTSDTKIAFRYYLIAAKEKHENALAQMKRLYEQSNSDELGFELGKFYEEEKNITPALRYYINSNCTPAMNALKRLAIKPEIAHQIGLLYGSNPIAIDYFMQAANNGYQESKEHLQTLVETGNAEVQYTYGHLSNKKSGKNREALRCLILAASNNNAKALETLSTKGKLTGEECLEIAGIYKNGCTGISPDSGRALEFYNRAGDLGFAQAYISLAEIYQVQPKNLMKSWEYYLKAAKSGNMKVFASLERLAKELPSACKVELAALYQSLGRNSDAIRLYDEAAQVGNEKARKALESFPKYFQASINGTKQLKPC